MNIHDITQSSMNNLGARNWDRTSDAQLFKLPLYRLSYLGHYFCLLSTSALAPWDSNPRQK